MTPKNLLIFPAGTEIAFEILNALKYSKFVKVFGGTSCRDHSEFVYKNLIDGFPYVDSPDFVDHLNKVIDEYHIDCIYPAHDSASVVLSENAENIHAQVIIADVFTTDICRSKEKTFEYFDEYSFIPRVYSNVDDVDHYPVFVKPAVGQGSNGAKKINNSKELSDAIELDRSLVICEYLPGEEYTVDCFTDRHGQLRVVKLRNRERIRAGISVRSRLFETDEKIRNIAKSINGKLNFIGAWFFQVKKNAHNEYKLMEISPRIPGTMGLSRNLGINFPMLTLFVFWGYDVDIIDNNYGILLDRAFYSAYKLDLQYDHVYLDFDDTLIINGKVNQDLMRFLYQASNDGKVLHLLTKHTTDIYEDLKIYHIDSSLFSDIVTISKEEDKADYIKEKNAIFIDDSFAERRSIKDRLGIEVFDIDMVESLIDWRN